MKKRTIQSILVGMLVFGSVVGSTILPQRAYAKGDATGATVVVSGVSEGAKGSAYQILTANWNSEKGNYGTPQWKWNPSLASFVRTNFPTYIDGGGYVTDVFSDLLSDTGKVTDGVIENKGAQLFYDKLSAALTGGEVTLTKIPVSDGATETFTANAYGSYLALFSGSQDIYRPVVANYYPTVTHATVTIPDTIQVAAKKATMPFDKEVVGGDHQVAIGDVVPFKITSQVPLYPANATHKVFRILDVTNPSLLQLEDAPIVQTIDYAGRVTGLIADRDYVRTVAKNGDQTTVTYDFAKAYANGMLNQKQKVTIEYKMRVTDKAQVNSDLFKNTAQVTYSTNPYTESDAKKEDQEKLMTYGILLTKQDIKTKNNISGATFEIAKGNGDSLSFVKEADGSFRLALPNETSGITKRLPVSTGGLLKVRGLDIGSYTLKEMVSPEGYIIAPDQTIEIADADKDGNADTFETGFAETIFYNKPGFIAPKTGDTGAAGMMVFGILASGSGLFILQYALRQRKEKK